MVMKSIEGEQAPPARMFKDISSSELSEGSVRSDLWKLAIKKLRFILALAASNNRGW